MHSTSPLQPRKGPFLSEQEAAFGRKLPFQLHAQFNNYNLLPPSPRKAAPPRQAPMIFLRKL